MARQYFLKNLEEEVKKAYFSEFNKSITHIRWERPPNTKLGDITIACYDYAKILKKSPVEIANTWQKAIGSVAQIDQSSVVGPYINFKYNYKLLAKYLFKSIETGFDIKTSNNTSEKIIIEFSSPNANKPLHLGHARNNAIGRFLCKLGEMLGHKTIAVNLINDRGVHICKSMLAYKLSENKKTPESENKKGDHFVGEYYVKYSQLEKENKEIITQVNLMLQKWEASDKKTIELWREMTRWVLDGFKETYARTNIKFDRIYKESEQYKGGKEIVLNALKEGICKKEENNAIAIDLDEYGLGKKILIRGDGTSVYITQDINTTNNKYNEFKPDKMFWVVGSEQKYHFKVLFSILKKLGYTWANCCQHISYGMIELPDGKMKSREGVTVDLDDLCDQMQEKAKKLLIGKNPDKKYEINQLNQIAESIGQAAINYYILRATSNKNIIFDYNESLNFEGMSGPYLQYTSTRIHSILEKSGIEKVNTKTIEDYKWQEEEVSILRVSILFSNVIKLSWASKNPAYIANYCYELCKEYNRFYQNNPILKTPDKATKEARIKLTILVQTILKKCLYLLNIQALTKM